MTELDAYVSERDDVIERQLVITSDIMTAKRNYLHGEPTMTMKERSILDAEYADLDVKRHRLSRKIESERNAERTRRKKSRYSILVKMLHDAGMAELINEADRESNCDDI